LEKFDRQADFADELGINESVVSAVLRGRRTLSPEAQDLWAAILNTTPEELGLRKYHD
jgi:transcriptional regulator with XRE-family HTH domain